MAAFCHWLEYEGTIEKPITARVRLPQFEKLFIPTFTPDDVEKLLAVCEADRRYTPRLQKAMTARNKEDTVFLSDSGKPLTIEGVSKLFQRLRKEAGIEGKRVSPHQCRRYMATTQLASGRSPLDVQRQMGHSSLQMTNHYASLGIQHLRRTHEAYSPLRAKQDGARSGGIGTGYWEEE